MIGALVQVPGATIDPPARDRVGIVGLLLDARRAYRGGSAAIAARQQVRLAAQVNYARTRSPFYRQLYAALPERVEDPRLLPVTGKAALMDRFDDWVPGTGTPAGSLRPLHPHERLLRAVGLDGSVIRPAGRASRPVGSRPEKRSPPCSAPAPGVR